MDFEWLMMCQCQFTLGIKCTILVTGVENVGGYACMGTEGTQEIFAPSSIFSWTKPSLKQ